MIKSKTVPGNRIPVILLCMQHSAECIEMSSSLFDEISGATIVFLDQGRKFNPTNSTGESLNVQLVNLVDNLIVQIRSELTCKQILVVDYHLFQSNDHTFRFFSHEPHSEISSVGHFLKGTFRDQLGVILDDSEFKCDSALVSHLNNTDTDVRCFQMGFSSELIDSENVASPAGTSKFKFALLASVIAAATMMRIESGELK